MIIVLVEYIGSFLLSGCWGLNRVTITKWRWSGGGTGRSGGSEHQEFVWSSVRSAGPVRCFLTSSEIGMSKGWQLVWGFHASLLHPTRRKLLWFKCEPTSRRKCCCTYFKISKSKKRSDNSTFEQSRSEGNPYSVRYLGARMERMLRGMRSPNCNRAGMTVLMVLPSSISEE